MSRVERVLTSQPWRHILFLVALEYAYCTLRKQRPFPAKNSRRRFWQPEHENCPPKPVLLETACCANSFWLTGCVRRGVVAASLFSDGVVEQSSFVRGRESGVNDDVLLLNHWPSWRGRIMCHFFFSSSRAGSSNLNLYSGSVNCETQLALIRHRRFLGSCLEMVSANNKVYRMR